MLPVWQAAGVTPRSLKSVNAVKADTTEDWHIGSGRFAVGYQGAAPRSSMQR